MRCPYCNSELSNDYCPKCGKKVYAPGNPIEQTVTLKKKKSSLGSVFILVILLGIFAGVFYYATNVLDKEGNNERHISENNEMISVLSEYGVPKYLSGNITSTKVNSVSAVYSVLESLSTLYKFNNPKGEFNVTSTFSEGITYYRMQQLYNTIKVYGHELVMSVDASGDVLSITGDYVPIKSLSNYSVLSESEVLEIINEYYEDFSVLSKERVIILNGDEGTVVYLIYILSEGKILEYVIDASNGEIMNIDESGIYNINYKYTGSGLSVGESINLEEYQDISLDKVRYKFVDNIRGIEIIDGSNLDTLYPNTSTPIVGDMNNGEILINDDEELTNSSVDAMKIVSKIYDYYYNTLGRKSYDGDGSTISVFVNVPSINDDYDVNAYYNRFTNQIFLGSYNGESLSSIDNVVAHEFNHAVISSSAKLGENLDKIYNTTSENQSGALSEAYSDILALLIESKNFVIGQGTETESIIGRDLSDPSRYNKPYEKNGENYYPSLNGKSSLNYLEDNNMESLYDFDNGGVHINSTVIGYAAYLSFKNNAYVSREEMARVWYNSLLMLTPTSDFEDCALAVIKTAENLGLSEKKVSIIRNAFTETGILKGSSYKLGGIIKSGDKALSNVKVSVINVNKTSDKLVKGSDKTGTFEFLDLEEGTYDIVFNMAGYAEVTERVVLNKDYSMEIELVRE